jgi:8-oxo-dGTP diphosphatase
MALSSSASSIDWTHWRGEILATLMFVVRDGEILLIEKKRGIGAGKINGPGGKIDPGETPLQCAIRETQEELHITVKEARKMGELCFAMSDLPDIHCHVFMADSFEGTPTETDEAVPVWKAIEEIPYDRMWADDIFWLPEMLSGKTFHGKFLFDGERIVWQEILFDVSFAE